MALDPRYWTELEQAGVQNEHLRMLVLMVRGYTNGNVSWHWRNGHLERCEMHLTFSGKPIEVQRVGERVFSPDETHLFS